MASLRELITGSLRLLNAVQAGQAPSADDMSVGTQALNSLIDSWSSERLLIYTISPHYFPLQGGKKDYTLGPGGDFDITRPLEIEAAYVTLQGAGTTVVIPGVDPIPDPVPGVDPIPATALRTYSDLPILTALTEYILVDLLADAETSGWDFLRSEDGLPLSMSDTDENIKVSYA